MLSRHETVKGMNEVEWSEMRWREGDQEVDCLNFSFGVSNWYLTGDSIGRVLLRWNSSVELWNYESDRSRESDEWLRLYVRILFARLERFHWMLRYRTQTSRFLGKYSASFCYFFCQIDHLNPKKLHKTFRILAHVILKMIIPRPKSRSMFASHSASRKTDQMPCIV
jgi:hypothetical protein